ncbi:phage/plasmid primase, P4 family [Dictyobacter arantiisoli]|uniref:SF3 helicase domain-containing protein n=1 Tax=Dictyobacter arantiisoli TaxID=2014874 RepID=A0A5A5TIM1_9CHLR|nr:phage/plasmid primase, P4 family [Dictyobacter arantiisoli]GCF10794.1 hypothetical protein KDI_43580 [Dictyobacter arantiisoli]
MDNKIRDTAALRELQNSPHWICWRKEKRNGSFTKIPYTPTTGRWARSNDPQTWCNYQQAQEAATRENYAGLGYMFHEDYTGIDLDHCVDEQGVIERWAWRIIKHLNSYTEFSPSGSGIHIFVRGQIPHGSRRKIPAHWEPLQNHAAIEMYCSRRYFTVTGNHVPETSENIESRQVALDKLYQQVSRPETATPTSGPPAGAVDRTKQQLAVSLTHLNTIPSKDTSNAKNPQHPNPPTTSFFILDDEELLQRACEASNGARFQALFYDGATIDYTSSSEADMALSLHLAFWTGRDSVRMDKLFRRSALYRTKWDAGRGVSTYGQETLRRACAICTETYTPRRSKQQLAAAIDQLLKQSHIDCERELQMLHEEKKWILKPHDVAFEDVLACLKDDEMGDAQLFAQAFADKVCYDNLEKEWYIWRDHAWKRDSTDKILQLVGGSLASIYLKAAAALKIDYVNSCEQLRQAEKQSRGRNYGETEKLGRQVEQMEGQFKQLKARAKALHSYRRIKNIMSMATSYVSIETTMWDSNPWLLAVPNGVLDLRTGQCNAGVPGDYLRTICPTEWAGLDTPCPRFEYFLEEIFADKVERTNIIAFLQRLLGYCITGSTEDHIFTILYGEEGRNGKDTLLRALHQVLGPIASAISNDIFVEENRNKTGGAPTPHLSDLQGKRVVWGSETRQGDRIDVARVKQLSGGGDINARHLYSKHGHTFTPTHKLLLMTNHKPIINSKEQAAWDRICLIDFSMRFVDHPQQENERPRDKKLEETLYAERSGILAWLMRGCLQWKKEGLNIPTAVQANNTQYRAAQDPIEQFIRDRCTIAPQSEIKASILYSHYERWHDDNRTDRPLSLKAFGTELSKRFEKMHTTFGAIYRGIGLYSPNHDARRVEDSAQTPETDNHTSMKNKDDDGYDGYDGSSPKLLNITSFNSSTQNKSFMHNPSYPSYPSVTEEEAAEIEGDTLNVEPYSVQIETDVSQIEENTPPTETNTSEIECYSVPIETEFSEIERNNVPIEIVVTDEDIYKGNEGEQTGVWCEGRWEDNGRVHREQASHQAEGSIWCRMCGSRSILLSLARQKTYPRYYVPSLRTFIGASATEWHNFACEQPEEMIIKVIDLLSAQKDLLSEA